MREGEVDIERRESGVLQRILFVVVVAGGHIFRVLGIFMPQSTAD